MAGDAAVDEQARAIGALDPSRWAPGSGTPGGGRAGRRRRCRRPPSRRSRWSRKGSSSRTGNMPAWAPIDRCSTAARMIRLGTRHVNDALCGLAGNATARRPPLAGRASLVLLPPLLLLATCGPPADDRRPVRQLAQRRGRAPRPHRRRASPTDAFIASDGARLPLRKWLPKGPVKAVILALHGFNDYSNALRDRRPGCGRSAASPPMPTTSAALAARPGAAYGPARRALAPTRSPRPARCARLYPGRPLYPARREHGRRRRDRGDDRRDDAAPARGPSPMSTASSSAPRRCGAARRWSCCRGWRCSPACACCRR